MKLKKVAIISRFWSRNFDLFPYFSPLLIPIIQSLVEFLINDHHLKVNERDENKKEALYDAIRAQNPEMI